MPATVNRVRFRCCFTGHRPEKLQHTEEAICERLQQEISLAIEEGYTTFVSGMAQGVDLWAAEQVLQLRESEPSLKLICAIPYEGVERRWPANWRQRFWAVRQSADYVQVVSPHYHPGVFAQRNRWMVDHCQRVIAVYNGAQGGTADTLRYALHLRREARCIPG